MLLVLGMIVFFVLLDLASGPDREERMSSQEQHEILMKRAAVTQEIKDWVNSINKKEPGKISEWTFGIGEFDKINIKFSNRNDTIYGKLDFIYDDGFPRVAGFTWVERDGIKFFLPGRDVPQISFRSLVEYYNTVKKSRLPYIEKIMAKAAFDGEAEFDLCEYENAPKEIVEQMYSTRELQALCASLRENFSKVTIIGDKIMVSGLNGIE